MAKKKADEAADKKAPAKTAKTPKSSAQKPAGKAAAGVAAGKKSGEKEDDPSGKRKAAAKETPRKVRYWRLPSSGLNMGSMAARSSLGLGSLEDL